MTSSGTDSPGPPGDWTGFDPQPTLEGDLVRLRPLRADDFDALYAVARDPLIWEQHPAHDRHQRPVFEAFVRDALTDGAAFVVEDLATGAVIGSSRYHGLNPDARQVEIGWSFLSRSHWGGRHNADLKRLMLAHAFRFVDSVVFLVGPDNIRSQRAMEKIGATRDGSRRDASGRESLVFRITAEAFGAGAGSR